MSASISRMADVHRLRIGTMGQQTENCAMISPARTFIAFAIVLLTSPATFDDAAAQRTHTQTCEELKRHGLIGGCPPAQSSPTPKKQYFCAWHEPSGANGTCFMVSFARVGGPCTCRGTIGKDHPGRVGFRMIQ
jgi:hypothetical protein